MRIEKEIDIIELRSFGWNPSQPLRFSSTLEVVVFAMGVMGHIFALDFFLFTDEYNSHQALRIIRIIMIILLICSLSYVSFIVFKIIYYEIKIINIVNNSIIKKVNIRHQSLSIKIIKILQEYDIGATPLIQTDRISVKYIPESIIPFHEIIKINETVIHIIIKQSMENDKGVSTSIIIGPINTSTYDYVLRIIKIISTLNPINQECSK